MKRTQRDLMRELALRLGGDETLIVRAYADAEQRGDVIRTSNSLGIEAEEYARRLYADAVKKGWLDETTGRRRVPRPTPSRPPDPGGTRSGFTAQLQPAQMPLVRDEEESLDRSRNQRA